MMFFQLLKKNMLNMCSSMNALGCFLTPYAIFSITYVLNVMDDIVVVSTWIIMLFFNSFFIPIFIKKRDIQSGNGFLYSNYNIIFSNYYYFSIIISMPYYFLLVYIVAKLAFLMFITGLFLNYISLKWALSIKKNKLIGLNVNTLSSFFIILVVGGALLIEYLISIVQ